jgi:hypothetical protein
MDLFASHPDGSGPSESCCFCGEALAGPDHRAVRVWLELPAPAHTRIMREHFCHEACFQQALAPAHRSGSGRPVERSPDGVILNALELTPDDLAHQRVLCPACTEKTFAMWPEGWDAHAAHRCAGVQGETQAARKAWFKRQYGHLFR